MKQRNHRKHAKEADMATPPKSGTREQKPTFVQQTKNKKDCIGLFSVPTRKNPTILGAYHQTSYFGQQMYIEYACARADTHISIIIYIYLHKKIYT